MLFYECKRLHMFEENRKKEISSIKLMIKNKKCNMNIEEETKRVQGINIIFRT